MLEPAGRPCRERISEKSRFPACGLDFYLKARKNALEIHLRFLFCSARLPTGAGRSRHGKDILQEAGCPQGPGIDGSARLGGASRRRRLRGLSSASAARRLPAQRQPGAGSALPGFGRRAGQPACLPVQACRQRLASFKRSSSSILRASCPLLRPCRLTAGLCRPLRSRRKAADAGLPGTHLSGRASRHPCRGERAPNRDSPAGNPGGAGSGPPRRCPDPSCSCPSGRSASVATIRIGKEQAWKASCSLGKSASSCRLAFLAAGLAGFSDTHSEIAFIPSKASGGHCSKNALPTAPFCAEDAPVQAGSGDLARKPSPAAASVAGRGSGLSECAPGQLLGQRRPLAVPRIDGRCRRQGPELFGNASGEQLRRLVGGKAGGCQHVVEECVA